MKFQRLGKFLRVDESAPPQASHHDGLVLGDWRNTVILRAAAPGVQGIIIIDNGGVITYHATKRRARLKAGQSSSAHDPEVGITCYQRALGGCAMPHYCIREFLRLAYRIVAIGRFNPVIRIIQVHLDHIDIERYARDAHDRVNHARPHLTTKEGVGRIGLAI